MIGLVCVGAGSGRRFGGDKLSEELAGVTVAEVSLNALHAAFPSAPLIFVVAADRVTEWSRQTATLPYEVTVVAGGVRRQDSVKNGVERLRPSGAEVVVLHDAARPLVEPDDVRRTVALVEGGASGAVLVARVPDTVKRVSDGLVVETVVREQLRLALTPQVFRLEALMAAWAQAGDHEVTDESMLLEACAMPVAVVEASSPNPKITVRSDLELARRYLDCKRHSAAGGS